MVTMVDEIFDRMYQQGRADLHRDVGRLFGSIASELGKSLKAMHSFEWSAPWAAKAKASKDVGCA
jgi:hypothetical protein